jgi:hypothetical protein
LPDGSFISDELERSAYLKFYLILLNLCNISVKF